MILRIEELRSLQIFVTIRIAGIDARSFDGGVDRAFVQVGIFGDRRVPRQADFEIRKSSRDSRNSTGNRHDKTDGEMIGLGFNRI